MSSLNRLEVKIEFAEACSKETTPPKNLRHFPTGFTPDGTPMGLDHDDSPVALREVSFVLMTRGLRNTLIVNDPSFFDSAAAAAGHHVIPPGHKHATNDFEGSRLSGWISYVAQTTPNEALVAHLIPPA